MSRRSLAIVFLALCALPLMGEDACDSDVANDKERDVVKSQDLIYARNQPAPTFDFSLERYLLTELYMARNRAVATFSYSQSPWTGKILWSCPSIGFPLAANTQLTNPQKISWRSGGGVGVLAQAEPNGLYTSPSTTGTFVMCTDQDGLVVPQYHEEYVSVTMFPVVEKDGRIVPALGATPSFTIDPNKRTAALPAPDPLPNAQSTTIHHPR